MTNREVVLLLLRIDNGYEPTEQEIEDLLSVKELKWNADEASYQGVGLWNNQDRDFYLVRNVDGHKHIPFSISMLENLQCLDLSNSSIDILPYTIGKLNNLRILDLGMIAIAQSSQ